MQAGIPACAAETSPRTSTEHAGRQQTATPPTSRKKNNNNNMVASEAVLLTLSVLRNTRDTFQLGTWFPAHLPAGIRRSRSRCRSASEASECLISYAAHIPNSNCTRTAYTKFTTLPQKCSLGLLPEHPEPSEWNMPLPSPSKPTPPRTVNKTGLPRRRLRHLDCQPMLAAKLPGLVQWFETGTKNRIVQLPAEPKAGNGMLQLDVSEDGFVCVVPRRAWRQFACALLRQSSSDDPPD